MIGGGGTNYHRVNIKPPLAITPNRNIWEILANNITPKSKFGKFWQITLPRTKIRARSARKILGFLGVLQGEIVKKVFKNGQSGGPKFWQITLPRNRDLENFGKYYNPEIKI